MEIGVADPASGHGNQDLAGTGGRLGNLLQQQRLVGGMEHGGSHRDLLV
jgi:hypothetical protein